MINGRPFDKLNKYEQWLAAELTCAIPMAEWKNNHDIEIAIDVNGYKYAFEELARQIAKQEAHLVSVGEEEIRTKARDLVEVLRNHSYDHVGYLPEHYRMVFADLVEEMFELKEDQ